MITKSSETEALLSPVWDTLFPIERRRTLKHIVKQVDCDVDKKRLGILFHDHSERMEFEAGIRRSELRIGWRKDVAIEEEPKLRKSLILAHQLRRYLDNGTIKNLQQAGEWLNMKQSYVEHTLGLLTLCPAIQEEILLGENASIAAVAEYQVRNRLPMEIDWQEQQKIWKEIKSTPSSST